MYVTTLNLELWHMSQAPPPHCSLHQYLLLQDTGTLQPQCCRVLPPDVVAASPLRWQCPHCIRMHKEFEPARAGHLVHRCGWEFLLHYRWYRSPHLNKSRDGSGISKENKPKLNILGVPEKGPFRRSQASS